MNILIPLGGMGERFINEQYNKPKPLIQIIGKPMIQHLIDNLNLQKEDNLIIVYNNFLNKYDFDNLITSYYHNVRLINLNFQTEGSVQTILYGLDYIKNHSPLLLDKQFVILDGDTIYNKDILKCFRDKNHNAIFCFNDYNDNPIYSYTNTDEKNIVIDIKEKYKISNLANTGCYCFENGNVLKFYCEKVIKENIREKNEFYTSCVIKEMLKDKLIFEAIIIDKSDFDCVGTPFQLKIYCIKKQNTSTIKKRFCFDLDNTLVTFPLIKNDYKSVNPIQRNIEYLRKLKKLGHTIIIYTARRMRTYNGNVGKIMQDIGKITIDTLEKFDIPYDELYFGKPYADFYIDDLAVSKYECLEKATGIYNDFINNRSFNKIEIIDDLYVKKTTTISEGLIGEIYYYKNIPENIITYFPKFIKNSGNNEYIVEKINGINLCNYFVSENVNEQLLLKLLNTIKNIHSSCEYCVNFDNVNIYSNYFEKNKIRFQEFDYSIFENYKIIYETIMNFLYEYEQNDNGIIGIIHGDPVFSNIIITEDENIKFIDMRGKLGNKLTIQGDIFYDYSKIYQSIIGYDEILLNKIVSNKYRTNLITVFEQFIINNFGKNKLEHIKMITNSLLLSLIPLHNNENIYKFFDLIKI